MDGGAVYGDMIACPHHQYTYDARTGANRYPKNVFPTSRKAEVKDIGTYPARDDGEWVWIRL
jgi:nitrite reductase/ring-hydroxylating ferredoxin subunit